VAERPVALPPENQGADVMSLLFQPKENCEKNQAVAEEMVRVNVDAVFESACRFIVMKSLPGWMDEICTEHLLSARNKEP
jgi:hypothetical protein